ncbi:MAG: hypothetical protein GY746_01200, partial [Gammaproteobacteria bacterium]|nr:hypothetical protein [Gammaproteobacteria bacterium]
MPHHLMEFSNLQILDLSDNQLEHVFGVEALDQLTSLDVSNNQITDINMLNAMAQLELLDLSSNDLIPCVDIEALKLVLTKTVIISPLGCDPDGDVDSDGVINSEDAFPTNPAASIDGDQDGMPDEWNKGCDADCQANSGLILDPYPNDRNNDGIPDTICNLQTDIPQVECETLVNFWESTGGSGWINDNGWNETVFPCGWYGVTCFGGHVTRIELDNNMLAGSLPDMNLQNLDTLSLRANQLVGGIPDFQNIPKLGKLDLYNNQLSGTIPDFSGLSNLEILALSDNQLTGTIPNLSHLERMEVLYLSGNLLTGNIPDLPDSLYQNIYGDSSKFGYNALTGDPTGEGTALDPDWADTQTIPPVGVTATQVSSTEVEVNWAPVSYTTDAGYCQVFYAATPGGSYTSGPITTDKSTSGLTVSDLTPGTLYYFIVKTTTLAHTNNQNDVISIASEEVTVPDTTAVIDDFNGDAKSDIMIRNTSNNAWWYYPMDGNTVLAGGGSMQLTRNG